MENERIVYANMKLNFEKCNTIVTMAYYTMVVEIEIECDTK